MRPLLRFIWAINIIVCLLSVFSGIDRSDEAIKAMLWLNVWVFAELVWKYERERAS